jgi:hypothetical protein
MCGVKYSAVIGPKARVSLYVPIMNFQAMDSSRQNTEFGV